MKKAFYSLLLTIGFLYFSSFTSFAQQKPALTPVKNDGEQALRSLLKTAMNANNNGLSLVDTSSRYFLNSSLKFPGASRNYLAERSVNYLNGLAYVSYNWVSEIAEIKPSDTITLNKTLGQLQETISRVLPKVRDSFYINKSYGHYMVWEWKPKKDVKLQLISTISDGPKNPVAVTLKLYAKTALKQDQNKITDSLIKNYTALTTNANTVNDGTLYFLSLIKLLSKEGLKDNVILEKIKVPFKQVANQNMGTASHIIFGSQPSFWATLKAELTPNQIGELQKIAQKISDDFDAKYNNKNKVAQNQIAAAPAKPQKEIFNAYYTNDQNPSASSKFVFISVKDLDGMYTFHDVDFIRKRGKDKWTIIRRGVDKKEGDFYFGSGGQKWIPVSIRDCAICYGTGTKVNRTPYTHYYEEKGIYNKYTYSGSGYNTTSETCSSCKGEGFWITRL